MQIKMAETIDAYAKSQNSPVTPTLITKALIQYPYL